MTERAPSTGAWWGRGVLLRILPPDDAADILGDLHEEAEARRARGDSESSVRRWMAWQMVLAAIYGLRDRIEDWAAARPRLAPRLETLRQDLRFALRGLVRNPGYALAVTGTLAVGIGTNAAMYTVVRSVLIRPLPFADDDRLVVLRQTAPGAGIANVGFAVAEVEDYRRDTDALEAVVEYHSMWFNLLGLAQPERVQTGVVSWGYFDVLGVEPFLGRTFRAGDDVPNADPVLVLSYDYWQDRFDGDSSVVGTAVQMHDRPHTIVGVLPPLPPFPRANDVYMPTTACPYRSSPAQIADRNTRAISTVLGRVRVGVDLAQVRREVAGVGEAMVHAAPEIYPARAQFAATADPLRTTLTRNVRSRLVLLAAAAVIVLLIVCVNVAGLHLARLGARQRELALRHALGAGEARLAQQLVTESMLLALIGGALGLAVAAGSLDLLVEIMARYTPRAGEIRLDAAVVAFTAAVAIGAGLLFGSLPIGVRRWGGTALRTRATQGAHPSLERARRLLVAGQIAVSVVLVVAASLTTRSLLRLQRSDLGFDAEHTVGLELDLDWTKYDSPAQRAGFLEPLLARAQAMPGVHGAALSTTYPLATLGHRVRPVRRRRQATAAPNLADLRIVSPGFFETMDARILTGRAFTKRDDEDGGLVAVINEALATALWGCGFPLGQEISVDGGIEWRRVVGVVSDAPYRLGEPDAAAVYVPIWQSVPRQLHLLARLDTPSPNRIASVVNAVYAGDPNQPVASVRLLQDVRRSWLVPHRLTTGLIGGFAVLALVVTAAGLAAVVAYTVHQRHHELGLRRALGARPSQIAKLVVRDGLVVSGGGLGIGIVAAFVLRGALAPHLIGIPAHDPVAFFAGTLTLLAAIALATIVPVHRAMRLSTTAGQLTVDG